MLSRCAKSGTKIAIIMDIDKSRLIILLISVIVAGLCSAMDSSTGTTPALSMKSEEKSQIRLQKSCCHLSTSMWRVQPEVASPTKKVLSDSKAARPSKNCG